MNENKDRSARTLLNDWSASGTGPFCLYTVHTHNVDDRKRRERERRGNVRIRKTIACFRNSAQSGSCPTVGVPYITISYHQRTLVHVRCVCIQHYLYIISVRLVLVLCIWVHYLRFTLLRKLKTSSAQSVFSFPSLFSVANNCDTHATLYVEYRVTHFSLEETREKREMGNQSDGEKKCNPRISQWTLVQPHSIALQWSRSINRSIKKLKTKIWLVLVKNNSFESTNISLCKQETGRKVKKTDNIWCNLGDKMQTVCCYLPRPIISFV